MFVDFNNLVMEIAERNAMQRLAYYNWEKRGRPLGGDGKEDWYQAKRQFHRIFGERTQYRGFINDPEARREAAIMTIAYQLWEKRGSPLGGDGKEDWHQADQLVAPARRRDGPSSTGPA